MAKPLRKLFNAAALALALPGCPAYVGLDNYRFDCRGNGTTYEVYADNYATGPDTYRLYDHGKSLIAVLPRADCTPSRI